MSNVSVIRTFRLFRPLRSFTSMPAMKSIISTMIASLTKLGEIMVVAVIFFYIFSILGVTLWNGKIHNRCYVTPEPVNGDWEVLQDYTRNCDAKSCPDGSYCGSLVKQYDNNPETLDMDIIGTVYRDTRISSLQYGQVSFDNIFYGFLTVFQCLTLEGWNVMMYNYQDSSGTLSASVYFVALVLM